MFSDRNTDWLPGLLPQHTVNGEYFIEKMYYLWISQTKGLLFSTQNLLHWFAIENLYLRIFLNLGFISHSMTPTQVISFPWNDAVERHYVGSFYKNFLHFQLFFWLAWSWNKRIKFFLITLSFATSRRQISLLFHRRNPIWNCQLNWKEISKVKMTFSYCHSSSE